ncbi:MAG: ABC transporter permease, partial [Acidobacteriaceae bacterium]|nr:ABC transporter permease [Acidobacteriaceae bacterium]
LGMFPDAIWHFALQDPVQEKIRNWARSPWTCLGSLAAVVAILALLSSGFGATRQVLISASDHVNDRLLFIWLHPTVGGPDKELPPDVSPAWARHSKLLEGVAGFHISKTHVTSPSVAHSPAVINTEPALFSVLRTIPVIGSVPSNSGVVLDQLAWKSLFRSNPHALGSKIRIGTETYTVTGVLPASFDFVTRQPKIFVVNRWLSDRVDVIARVKPGVSMERLDRELVRISEDDTYYFFHSQLRMSNVRNSLWTPVRLFGVAVLASALVCLWVAKLRIAHIRSAFLRGHRKPAAHRALFFVCKVALGLTLVFVAGLEWSRSQSAILFSSRDPGSGPFLLWLYILLAMGVFFWAVADQRARCRVCLRLLCFPVRIGCPGCLLLDWSGIELLCTEGHGVLHVPHMAASWDEESQRWIALDESWKELFAGTK